MGPAEPTGRDLGRSLVGPAQAAMGLPQPPSTLKAVCV